MEDPCCRKIGVRFLSTSLCAFKTSYPAEMENFVSKSVFLFGFEFSKSKKMQLQSLWERHEHKVKGKSETKHTSTRTYLTYRDTGRTFQSILSGYVLMAYSTYLERMNLVFKCRKCLLASFEEQFAFCTWLSA